MVRDRARVVICDGGTYNITQSDVNWLGAYYLNIAEICLLAIYAGLLGRS